MDDDTSDTRSEANSVSSSVQRQIHNGAADKGHLRSGKILAVKLRNFMCHKNLTVDFNQRTNLLVGNNGSGKSAVLTALIIGLGCKANATNRSNSIKRKYTL